MAGREDEVGGSANLHHGVLEDSWRPVNHFMDMCIPIVEMKKLVTTIPPANVLHSVSVVQTSSELSNHI